MTLAGLLNTLLSLMRDPWAGVEAWRQRREAVIAPSKPTYDAYPDRVEEADMWLTLHSRDAFGRVLGENVDLRGHSANLVNFETPKGAKDLGKAVTQTRLILRARLRLASIRAAKRREERTEAAYQKAVAREAREQKRG